MRFCRLIIVGMLPLIVACKILPQNPDQPPPQNGINQTELSGGEGQPVDGTIRPKPRPGSAALDTSVDPAAELPTLQPEIQQVEQKSQDQIICEKRGGNWSRAGKSSSKTCIKRTRDAGKECRKQGDCSSICLARSGTCAPVAPLFGCNEIFQNDGSRVTLCID